MEDHDRTCNLRLLTILPKGVASGVYRTGDQMPLLRPFGQKPSQDELEGKDAAEEPKNEGPRLENREWALAARSAARSIASDPGRSDLQRYQQMQFLEAVSMLGVDATPGWTNRGLPPGGDTTGHEGRPLLCDGGCDVVREEGAAKPDVVQATTGGAVARESGALN